jgi:uncharacterized protein YjbJ (UPF0337 family)
MPEPAPIATRIVATLARNATCPDAAPLDRRGRNDDPTRALPYQEVDRQPLGKQRRNAMGEFTEKAKGLANEAAGNVKQAIGKATDDERLRAEGEMQERKGEAQNLKGKVQGALGDKV